MTLPSLRIGILGTGKIVERALLDPAKSVPEVSISAVASRDPARARAYASAHGIARAHSYEGLLADAEVELVYISLPPACHAEWSVRALQAGKHVLCEKPLSANEQEARAIVAEAEKSGLVYMEAFHFPYHPFAKRLRDLLDTKVIGNLTGAEARFQIPGKYISADNIRRNFALGGGALMDAGCYALYALRQLLGEPERVAQAHAEVSGTDPQVDLRMSATLVFPGGRVGKLEASFLAEESADVAIVLQGEHGRLEVNSLYVPQWGGSLQLCWGNKVYSERAEPTPSYVYQLRELVRCVRSGAPVLTSAENGLLNMRTIDAIYRKAGLRERGLL